MNRLEAVIREIEEYCPRWKPEGQRRRKVEKSGGSRFMIYIYILPPVEKVPYDKRPRAHNRCLRANLTCVQKKNFINRKPYKDSF